MMDTMPLVKSHITVSLDGYCAGPDQSRDAPLGVGGEQLHRWMFPADDGEPHPVDAAVRDEILAGVGAFVMGRNMFGGRSANGQWDLDWQGWWGDDPPYHGPVFVLTHVPREPLEMAGGTTFFFVTDGIEDAVARARQAAGDRDVSVAGGASTVQQALNAGLLDELSVNLSPVLLGAGERLLDGLDGVGFEQVQSRASDLATHVRYRVVRD